MRKLLSIGLLAAAMGFAAVYPFSHASSMARPPTHSPASSASSGSARLTDEYLDPDDYPTPEAGYYIYNFGYLDFDTCQSDGYTIQNQLGFSPKFYCASGDGPYALYLQDSTGG